MAIDDPLSALQSWFKDRADGEWEHQFGIRIESLDNPGWSVVIDVEATDLVNKPFNEISRNSGQQDWLTCRVVDRHFEAYGDIGKLAEILKLFTAWVRA